MKRSEVYALIDAERTRQQVKWGGPHSWGEGDCSAPLDATVKLAVLTEEVGEVAQAVLEDRPGLRDELVQVAAVAVAWLEAHASLDELQERLA